MIFGRPGACLLGALALGLSLTGTATARGRARTHSQGTSVHAGKQKHSQLHDSIRKRDRPPGEVLEVEGGRAYVSGGRDEGLTTGMQLALRRGSRPVAKCTVVVVGDHRAACEGALTRPGDRFTLPGKATTAAAAAPVRPLSPEETDRREAIVTAASTTPHAFKAAGGLEGQVLGVAVGLGHTSWFSTSADFQREQVSLQLHGVPIYAGVRANLDALVTGWSTLPTTYRYPQKTRVQIYVREASFSFHEPGSWLSASAGRIFPVAIPGLPLFDGGQFGWRSPGDTIEVGAFAGAVPEPVLLRPSLARLAAGAYVAAHQVNPVGILRLVQEEARVAYMSSPEFGQRLEAEARVRAWFGRVLDIGAWVRFGVGSTMAPAALDGARLDMNFRAGDAWHVTGGVRYTADTALDVPVFSGYGTGSRTLQADASVRWEPAPWIAPALSGWVSSDLGTGLTRDLIGPEIGFPRAFGSMGGASVGYLQEFGWARGRNAYVQATLQPVRWFRGWLRLSYFDTQLAPAPAAPEQEVGLYASADFSLQRWLSIRLSALGRVPVATTTGIVSAGGWVDASLVGRF